MNAREIAQRIKALIAPDVLNEWELEEQAESIAAFSAENQQELLKQYAVIWPVSHALCSIFLLHVNKALACLTADQLAEWVNAALDAYETGGLRQAGAFMADVENNFLCKLRGETGISLEEAAGRLRPYVRGLGGSELDIAPSAAASTDTATIFLPREISLFKEQRRNFLLYKLIASFQWGFIASGTYRWQADAGRALIQDLGRRYGVSGRDQGTWLETLFALFPDRRLGRDVFHFAETVRVAAFLSRELPGLMRDATPLYKEILRTRPDHRKLTGTTRLLEELKRRLCADLGQQQAAPDNRIIAQAETILKPLTRPLSSVLDSARAGAELYAAFEPAGPGYAPTDPLIFQGLLKPAAAEAVRTKRRQERKQRFIEALAAFLPQQAAEKGQAEAPDTTETKPARLPDTEGALLMLMPEKDGDQKKAAAEITPAEQTFITLNDEHVRLPEDLKALLRDIKNDLGQVPAEYISSAVGLAGSGTAVGAGREETEDSGVHGPIVYDEWDFRRAGFRKNWCVLHEKEILPVKGGFVENTQHKYRGLLIRLRRQFEMMRTQQRFVRRQQDGDDLDLDAIIESLADSKAGLAPSERLFVRLLRNERNIAVVFLVDMSSSTEGWISTAIKESLILMCEALHVLGDSYAIYGFSGMRRLRSELYHIKHLDEPYGDTVKGKIAAIAPQDYTRMGPPIRHVSRLLAESDAKIRLLITLSDGKPEDYDDYKGDYAIEDTRHALIEAKAAGIHPFCITIDQQAHAYIAHMYGEVNYISINDVHKLPNRMPEIYRALTT